MDDPRFDEALALAYRHLSRRDRSVAEVRAHLVSRGYEDTAGGVIDALVRQGYLDDERLARRFAEDRRSLDSWGSERIARRLSEIGVARELIEAAVEESGEGELEAAVAFLRRRLGSAPGDDRERNRALGMLVRRGYELELAYDAVRALEREAA